MKKTTRLILLIALALTVALAAGCAKSADEITVVLDWTPNTNHTGLYVALENGYFEEQGLDVEIIQPADGSAEQLVAAGTAQFGISFQENVTLARAEGMPVVSIAAVIQHNTSGFISRVEENIKSPADFEGKKYGGWGTDIETTTVKYLMEKAGADPEKVGIVTMGDTDFFAASEAGEIDFAWIYEGWTLLEAGTRGVSVNYFNMKDFDEVFDYYTPVIITSEKNITENDETITKFMKAVVKGYEYAIQNPSDAAGMLLKHAPELDEELILLSQEFLADRYKDDAPYWGYQNKNVWLRYTEWLYENGFIEEMIEVEEAYTNAYLQ